MREGGGLASLVANGFRLEKKSGLNLIVGGGKRSTIADAEVARSCGAEAGPVAQNAGGDGRR